jgi:ribose 5-phosphate isomerase B
MADTGGWRIGLGADRLGLGLKTRIRAQLERSGNVASVVDYGVQEADDDTPYPHIGFAVATSVAQGAIDRALLICGTGIGMAICANKVPGVRAAVAHDPYSLERCVLSNDCQVLAFGARIIDPEIAVEFIGSWLRLSFDNESPSNRKVALLHQYERRLEPDRTHVSRSTSPVTSDVLSAPGVR